MLSNPKDECGPPLSAQSPLTTPGRARATSSWDSKDAFVLYGTQREEEVKPLRPFAPQVFKKWSSFKLKAGTKSGRAEGTPEQRGRD